MIWLREFQNTVKPKKVTVKRVEEIPVEQIKPNPYQPRKSFSEKGLEELSQSIREYGVIQPITVRRTASGGYELIAGERRLRASKMANMESIPAIIIDSFEKDSAIIAMIENLQRENLHYIEEAKGYASLIDDHGFTQEALAKKLGKSQSTIANKLRLLKLPDEIKEIIISNNLTERHARALLRLPDQELQLKAVQTIIKKELNVKESEEFIQRMMDDIHKTEEKNCQKKKFVKTPGDVRIFVNTIKNAVNMLKNYGLSPQFTQIDNGDSIEITVKIPKG
ncbi:nucleoid occlusion protein [Xylanivirga thermophila]|jgi:ParB family chromosome partitioning protein|uniref:nucleoid occlusion protein n=1 Tax=Xylanivirga thermophila TaxID=2496273 RepID=UPI00101BF932|nr:nucleoid occlusion protein [Xylanivirga thermophila]